MPIQILILSLSLVSMPLSDAGSKALESTRVRDLQGTFISAASVSPDGQFLFAVDWNETTIGVWDISSGKKVRSITYRDNLRDPVTIDVFPRSGIVTLTAKEGAVTATALFDIASGKELVINPGATCALPTPNHGAVFTSDGILGRSDPFLTIRSLAPTSQGDKRIRIARDDEVVGRGCLLDNNRLLFLVRPFEEFGLQERESNLTEVDLETGSATARWTSRVTRGAVSIDRFGRRALLVSEGIAEVVNLKTHTLEQRIQCKPSSAPFGAADLSKSGRFVACGAFGVSVFDIDRKCFVFRDRNVAESLNWPVSVDNPTEEVPQSAFAQYLFAIRSALVCLQFVNDAQLVGVTHDGTVYVWEVPSGCLTLQFTLSGERTENSISTAPNHTAIANHLESLRNGTLQERREAIYRLHHYRPQERIVDERVVDAIANDDWFVRCAAIQYVAASARPIGREGVRQLSLALSDHSFPLRDFPVRASAAFAIARLSIVDQIPSDQIVEALRDDDWYVRTAIAEALAALGPRASEFSSALGDILAEKPFPVLKDHLSARRASAIALRNMGSRARPALPAIVQSLSDEVSQIRELACQTIGECGFASNDTITQLRKLLDDKDAGVRREARAALSKVDRNACKE